MFSSIRLRAFFEFEIYVVNCKYMKIENYESMNETRYQSELTLMYFQTIIMLLWVLNYISVFSKSIIITMKMLLCVFLTLLSPFIINSAPYPLRKLITNTGKWYHLLYYSTKLLNFWKAWICLENIECFLFIHTKKSTSIGLKSFLLGK